MPRHASAFVALAILAPVLGAHESWALPHNFAIPPKGEVTVDLTTGTAFPEFEVPVKPERVARAVVRHEGERQKLARGQPQARSLAWTIPFEKPGVAVFGVE